MKRLLLICVLALLLVPSALAGQGSSPSVEVNPNPVAVNTDATVSGCGYRAAEQLWVGTVVGGNYATADPTGCFSLVRQFSITGQITVIVYDAANGKVKSKGIAATSVSVT